MIIPVLLLFAIVSPFAALYSLEYTRNGIPKAEAIRGLFLPTRAKQIATYVFFGISAIALFIHGDGDLLSLIIDCFLITLGYIAALTDLFTRRVPNKLVLLMLGIWIFLALARIFIDLDNGMESLIASLFGFLIGAGLMLIIYLISRKGLGAGDVKFMAVAGLYLSHRWILAVMLVGGVLCLLSAIVLMLMKKINLSDSLPLVPFLYIGILLSIILR